MEKPKYCTYRILVFALVAVNFLLLCTLYSQPPYITSQQVLAPNSSLGEESCKDFLVSSTKCRIPNLDPWNAEMKPYFKGEKYIACSNKNLLTYVEKNGTDFFLRVDQTLLPTYSNKPIKCCYMNVSRSKSKEDPDNLLSMSKCLHFKNQVKITEPTVKVKCTSAKEVYSNTHTAIVIDEKVQTKLNSYNRNLKRLSMLIVGIDSISRLNFIRTLPKTHNFLTENDWVEYKGYNKMGENTFPNLMAILTGRNVSSAYHACPPTVLGKLDACNFIWKDYNNLGYVTGYAEDEAKISTFNFLKKGFNNTPVDYYFRPYMMAAQTLKLQKVDGMNYCTGPEMSGERILNLAKDFSTTFKEHPNFGFFWMNSFSHNKINSPTRMDTKVLQFFEDISDTKVLENSVVIFLSDHGMRFGKARQTSSGWLEERLPFLYFWVPTWFKRKFSDLYNSLKLNGGRLTSPYDLYMTLQDVLALSGLNYTTKASEGCPNCRSLFRDVEAERSCKDAGIEPHWCTCTGYEYISNDTDLIKEAANFIVSEINNLTSSKNNDMNKCREFKLLKILSSGISTAARNRHQNDNYLLIVIETEPEAVFEVTVSVKYNASRRFERTGGISRLDSYQWHSNCVSESSLKSLCYCL